MTTINPIRGADALSGLLNGGPDARSVTAAALGELGQRALSWVGHSGGSSAGAQIWNQATGAEAGFRPDAATLNRGGDIYGIDQLAREIGEKLTASPTQEGDLRRALQDFTRGAVVQFAGLSGASGEAQTESARNAIAAALEAPAGEGVEGVIARIDHAAAALNGVNGA